MSPPTTGQMGGAHQSRLSSGDLGTHLFDDLGHHHEVCLQPAEQHSVGQVSDNHSATGLLFYHLTWTYWRGSLGSLDANEHNKPESVLGS